MSSRRKPLTAPRSKPRPRRPLWKRLLLWGGLAALVLALLGAGGLALLFAYYGSDPDLPRIASVRDYQPRTVTRILDRKGVAIGEISVERRTMVPYHRIPRLLVQAVLASEDADFFKHRGLDYPGMLRAFFVNLRAGSFVQGGSTITQQVVKTYFLSAERTIRRKMQEVILARRLESELTKEEILFLYLNQIYFGHGRYGVQEASRFYFGREVDHLELGQIALLAGLLQSPERLSPFKHPERAKQRQTYVLDQMARRNVISPQVARREIETPIQVVRNRQPYFNQAAEINDQVRADLIRIFGSEKLGTLGLQVQTAVDIQLQLAAREALEWGLRALDARQGFRGPASRLSGRALTRAVARLKQKPTTRGVGRRHQAVVTAVHDETEELEVDLADAKGRVLLEGGGRYNPHGHAPSKRFRAGDLIWVVETAEGLRFDAGPQGAMVVMDPETGDVLAMVGGYDFSPGQFNRAIQAKRQPGSAFKPFLYAAALDSGKFTPASIVEDAPVVIAGWEPKNFDGVFRGPMRLRLALAHSVNTVSARLMEAVGVEPVRTLATAMGISTPLGQDLSLALGTSEVRLLDLAAAYACIANGGRRVEPQFILRIGKEPVQRPEGKQVLRPEVAYVLTHMMQSVVLEGTATRARQLRRPVAGKTGTTNEQRDAWFIGFTPGLLAAVWIGFDEPRSLGRMETGGQAALPIWLRFMRQALKSEPRVPFKQPPNVVVQRIDPQTGLLAPDGATDVVEEVFVAGTEPKEIAPTPDQVNPDTILMNPGAP